MFPASTEELYLYCLSTLQFRIYKFVSGGGVVHRQFSEPKATLGVLCWVFFSIFSWMRKQKIERMVDPSLLVLILKRWCLRNFLRVVVVTRVLFFKSSSGNTHNFEYFTILSTFLEKHTLKTNKLKKIYVKKKYKNIS